MFFVMLLETTFPDIADRRNGGLNLEVGRAGRSGLNFTHLGTKRRDEGGKCVTQSEGGSPTLCPGDFACSIFRILA